MFAYNYDKETREYVGYEICEKSPLEQDKFLIPANSTNIAPPEHKDGMAIIWDDTAWIYVEDNRNKRIFLKQDSRIAKENSCFLLDPIPEDFTIVAPPDFEKKYVFLDGIWTEYQKSSEETIQDYDNAMENYLRETRFARGYTLREPSDYKDSSVARWKQDAIDWIAFRDAVLVYGLEVENTAQQTGVIPSMQEFLAGMPVITWTYQE